MLPPICQCTTGHSICKNCKTAVNNECPTCKEPIQTKNFAMDTMSQYLIYPCKNRRLGCQFTGKPTDMEIHDTSCEYGPLGCPLKVEKNCEWFGSQSELLIHVGTEHGDTLLKNDRIEVPYNSDTICTGTYLIICYKKIFKLSYKHENQSHQWNMRIIGSTAESKQFQFEIDLIDSSGQKKRFLISGLVTPLTVPINDTNCIKLSDEIIRMYVGNNKLAYRLTISKEL